jgi:hypothetical protein
MRPKEEQLLPWTEAVNRVYSSLVSRAEYNVKATLSSTARIARFMRDKYVLDEIVEHKRLIVLLFDFLAYNEVSRCEHPNVFADDKPFKHCYVCDEDIPRQEL